MGYNLAQKENEENVFKFVSPFNRWFVWNK